MAMANVNSFALVAFITLFLVLLNGASSSDSVSFTFSTFGPNQMNIILQGDAHIPRGSNRDSPLVLTRTETSGRPARNSVGRALYSTPVRLWDRNTGRLASFSTSFTFVLTSPNIPADGFAFFMAPTNTTIPPDSSGGLLGLFSPQTALHPNLNQVIAVEFDTFVNRNWDPNGRHLGIDVNSIRSRTTVNWVWRNATITQGIINYDASSRRLEAFTQQYRVSLIVDLRSVLPEWVRIGFSASTGDHVQQTRLHSWIFRSSLDSSNSADKDKDKEEEDMYDIVRDA